jgi:hypothetical protein
MDRNTRPLRVLSLDGGGDARDLLSELFASAD